jgi:hypothetical protein
MAHGKDYIPNKDAEFDNFFKFMNQYVAEKCGGQIPDWTHIPVQACQSMADAYTAWYAAYVKTIGPHTPVDTEAKNDAKKAAKAVIRPFVNQYLRFPPVTDQDREAMGIPNRDEKPTPIPKPATRPEFRLAVKDTRLINVHFQDQGSTSKAKPYGYEGAVIYWAVAAAPFTNPDDLPHSTLATRTPYTLEFAEADRGKTVSVALCWQNDKGGKGSPTEVQTAIVP